MTFKENARLDTSQVGTGGGRGRVGGGGLAAGGGLGGLLLLILYMVFGGGLGGEGGTQASGSAWNFAGEQVSDPGGQSGTEAFPHCQSGADANEHLDCPLDALIYIDISFFQQLERMGGDGGTLSQLYVVAHEYGHHVQNLIGVLGRAQQDPQGPESGAVRVELQADCFAGVWVAHADG